MKKIKTKAGYIAYETTIEENMLLGGRGVCDDCNSSVPNGYLVPVLNHYVCLECYKDFDDRSKYYPEDIPFETKNAAYFEAMIPMEGGSTK